MTRYVIWHTPRTGSNVLCDCLVQTKRAGMRRLNDAGFFIGFGEEVKTAYETGAVDGYFERNRTKNGVEGCKVGWDYVEHLNAKLPFGVIDDILISFDKHIVITRKDKVAQAVSRLIARQSGQWTSLDSIVNEELTYHREHLSYFIAQAAGYEMAVDVWLGLHGITPLRLEYETNALDWHDTVTRILRYVGVTDKIPQVKPKLKKQKHPFKAIWISKYERGE